MKKREYSSKTTPARAALTQPQKVLLSRAELMVREEVGGVEVGEVGDC